MPINGRLDKENVAYIQHGMLCSHNKEQDQILCRDKARVRGHYPCPTNTGTENQIPNVLTCKSELNDENSWTHRGEQHTLGPVMGEGEGEHQEK